MAEINKSNSKSDNNQAIKDAGLKVTSPRLKILYLLQQPNNQHVSAEDVYKLLLETNEEIGLATIYRVLNQFEDAGIISRHQFENGKSVFELKSQSHHDHIVCLDCGHVTEFSDSMIEERQRAIAKEHGIELTHHSLYLYGTCLNNSCDKTHIPKK